MQDEDIALRVDGDARRAAEIHARRQLEIVGNGDVVERWGEAICAEPGEEIGTESSEHTSRIAKDRMA